MITSLGEKNIGFFCQSHSSFKTRFGVLSLYQARFSTWFEMLLLSFEYFQLLALTILFHPNVSFISKSANDHSFIFDFVAYIMKLGNPSYLLDFTHGVYTTNVMLAIVLAYTLMRYLLMFYVIYVSCFSRTPNSALKAIWRCLFKLQGRVTCCFITSFWVKTIVMTSDSAFSIQGISNRVLIAISAVLIIIEYSISFILETQFCNFLPSKRYLASKNYEMQIITLSQKLLMQMIQVFAYRNPSFSLWACIVLNLIISLIREYRFSATLPLYNYKPLLYQGDLSAIVLSLHFAHFFQQILVDSEYSSNIDFRFLVILWIIIATISCRISRSSIKQVYLDILTHFHPQRNPYIQVHKIFATKDLIKNTMIPAENSEKVHINHLVGITQNLNIPYIFNIQEANTSYSKGDEKVIFLEYLRNLNCQFPKNSLIKLNLAYQKYKSTTTSHSSIIKITSKFNQDFLSPYQMSSALLLLDLEIKNSARFNNDNENSLDLLSFMENQILMQDIESDILKQISLRKQICESIIGEKPDLEAIYQNSQIIHKSKILIQNKITSFLKRAPEQYLDPLLVFAEYYLYLNYSMDDYQNHSQNYYRKLIKFTKEFELNKISQENLYQNENAYLIISAADFSIAYSTKSLQDICGPDRNNYINTQITRLFPHSLREYYEKIFKEHTSTNQSIPVYLSHKRGWLVEADMYIRVHPYMSQGLYLNVFLRPHRRFHDIILLDEAGNIKGVTQTIHQFIDIPKQPLNIKQISEDLSTLNQAFDIVKKKIGKVGLVKKFSKKKTVTFAEPIKNTMDYEKALRLYNLYITHTKVVKLSNNRNFQCDISKLDFDNFSLNLIKLEAVSQKAFELPEDSIAHDIEQDKRHRAINDFPIKETTTTQYNNNETDENLISPTSSRQFFKYSFLPVSSNRKPLVKSSTIHLQPIPQASTISTASNENSKNANSHDISKNFKRVINTPSHQKSFKFLCLIFYGVILGTLICQIVLKSALDNTMSHLITKTDLLNFAQRRTLQACAIHNVARGCSLLITGVLTTADMNLADTPLRSNLANMVLPEQILTQSNEGIINNIASENSLIQKMLFEKDILIKGSIAEPEDPKTEYITNFQHSDILRNAIKLLNGLELLAAPPGAKAFEFLTMNSANSFLVKNDHIIQTFQASVDDQKQSLQFLINLFVIILPLLLAGIVCLLSIIIFKQYTKEKRHLLAFLRLNPISIKHILENLKSFEKKLVQQEKTLNNKLASKSTYRSEQHDTQITSYHKGHDSQRIIYVNIQMRYFGYIFKVLFYITLLIAIVIANYISISNSIEGIYRQQRQIQFANDAGSTLATTYIAFAEMFVTNNTNYIKGQPPFEVFLDGRKNVSKIQATFYDEFQLKNGEYDPDVKSILFDQFDCNRFTASSYDNCISLKSLSLPTDLASTITLFKNQLDLKLSQFLAVNRSSIGAMIAAAVTNLSLILAPYRVSSAEAQLISEIISAKLAHSVDDIYDLGTTILTIFSVTLVVVSVLIWLQILTKVKRVNDNFKKVLAVLPPNIILSSFLLKSFLNKTSNIPQKF